MKTLLLVVEKMHEFLEIRARMGVLLEANAKLVMALFKPAIISGRLSDSDMEWLKDSCSCRDFVFSKSLLPLSEFYMDKNEVLSSAIWGIWNSITYMNNQEPLLSHFFRSKRSEEKRFLGYCALVATAAIHFADGNAQTTITSDAFYSSETYQQQVNAALNYLGKR